MGAVLPLLGLRAFTEVGRHGSVKQAAETLGVTPGAVSQQVRQLEERVGVPLFDREHRGLHLNVDGARVHAMLARAFDQIEDALAILDAIQAGRTLTVNTVPSFAASWLVPRLGRFREKHPDIEIKVEASDALVDLKTGGVDVALRHGLGKYPGLEAERFLTPVLVPVAAPSVLRDGPDIKAPADCLHYPLLQDSDRADWTLWLRALGLEDDPRTHKGPSFDDDMLLIRAAIAGQGIALVSDVYAREELASGRLALAIEWEWPKDFAYYIVTRPNAQARGATADFVAWIRQEAGLIA